MVVVLEWNQTTLTLVVKGSEELTEQTEFNNSKIINITGSFSSTAPRAFYSYLDLEEIYLPESLTSIGNGFIYKSKVRQIFFPKNVQYLDVNLPFDYNFFLHDFIVDKNNQFFSSIDGVLFSKDYKTMCFYPTGRNESTYCIPEGTETISKFSFDSCSSLKHIIIPTTCSSVSVIAYNLVNLQSVIALRCTKDPLPELVSGDGFFSGMDYYKGGITYSYNYFTYSIILDKRLVISPCARNGISYCSFNSTVFKNNKQITEIIIDEGITSICSDAFSGCSQLHTLSIPITLSEIASNSFSSTGLGKCSNILYPKSKYLLLLSSGIPQIAFSPCFCSKIHSSTVFNPLSLFFVINTLI